MHGVDGEKLIDHGFSEGFDAHLSQLTSTGRSLAYSRGGVQHSIGRYQDIRHLLGELHVPQAIVKGGLTVRIPQQAELGAAACLVPEA